MTTTFERCKRLYQTTAVIALNTILLFGVVYCILAGVFALRDAWKTRPENNLVSRDYGIEALRKAYPGWKDSEIHQLLFEHWMRPAEYEPFTQYLEAPFRGQFLTVHPAGFRHVPDQAPWPPRPDHFNIFLFGGSTTFGYGLPDDQTLAAFLQPILQALHPEVALYNFGRAGYYSSQELTLFQRLLADGIQPDLAVFIDGMNEFFYENDEPLHTARLKTVVNSRYMEGFETRNPMVRLARNLQRYLRSMSNPQAPPPPTKAATATRVAKAVDRYLHNSRQAEAVAQLYAIPTLFVWQPIPNYRYNLDLHPFAQFGLKERGPNAEGYQYLEVNREALDLPENFLWLADIQQDATENLYVDQIHYNPILSRQMAQSLAEKIHVQFDSKAVTNEQSQ